MWYYIQSIKGIRRDDYHYNHVNKLLNIGFKTYIKMVRVFATVLFECGAEAELFYSAHSSLVQVACYPEQVRLSNFDTMVNYGLVSSEKVGLLVANLSVSQFTSVSLFQQVHVNLLILEARLQAELLYVSKAIMNHMK